MHRGCHEELCSYSVFLKKAMATNRILARQRREQSDHTEDRVCLRFTYCLQAPESTNFFPLELVTWLELATFNWDKTLEKNTSCMQMTPSVILLNIRSFSRTVPNCHILSSL